MSASRQHINGPQNRFCHPDCDMETHQYTYTPSNSTWSCGHTRLREYLRTMFDRWPILRPFWNLFSNPLPSTFRPNLFRIQIGLQSDFEIDSAIGCHPRKPHQFDAKNMPVFQTPLLEPIKTYHKAKTKPTHLLNKQAHVLTNRAQPVASTSTFPKNVRCFLLKAIHVPK